MFDASDDRAARPVRFLERQKALLEACLSGEEPGDVDPHEAMLVELVRHADRSDPRLVAYLRHMMLVMEFDVGRRGRLVTAGARRLHTLARHRRHRSHALLHRQRRCGAAR